MALLFAVLAACCFAYPVVRVVLDDRAEARWHRRHNIWLEAHGRQLRARISELNRGLPAR